MMHFFRGVNQRVQCGQKEPFSASAGMKAHLTENEMAFLGSISSQKCLLNRQIVCVLPLGLLCTLLNISDEGDSDILNKQADQICSWCLACL